MRHFVSRGRQTFYARALSAERHGRRDHHSEQRRPLVHRQRGTFSIFVLGQHVRVAHRVQGSDRGDGEMRGGQHDQPQRQKVPFRPVPVQPDPESQVDGGQRVVQRSRERRVRRGLRNEGAVEFVQGVLRREDQAHAVLVELRERADIQIHPDLKGDAAIRQDRTLRRRRHGRGVQQPGESIYRARPAGGFRTADARPGREKTENIEIRSRAPYVPRL